MASLNGHLHQREVVTVPSGLKMVKGDQRAVRPPECPIFPVETLETSQIPDLEDQMAEGLHLHGHTSYRRENGSDDGSTHAVALFGAHRGPNRPEVV